MKKLFSLITALLMLCMALSAMAEAPDTAAMENVYGDWYAVKMSDGNNTVDFAYMGLAMSLNIAEDGKVTMTMSSEEGDDVQEGSWKITDDGIVISMADEAQADSIDSGLTIATLIDGELHMANSEQTIIFSPEKPEPIVFADPKEDAVADDFNGTFKCAFVKNGVAYMPAEAAANMGLILPDITIEGGKITVNELDEDSLGFGAILGSFNSLDLTFEDGTLKASAPLAEGVEGLGTNMKLSLLQDGMLSVSLFTESDPLFDFMYTPVTEVGAAE